MTNNRIYRSFIHTNVPRFCVLLLLLNFLCKKSDACNSLRWINCWLVYGLWTRIARTHTHTFTCCHPKLKLINLLHSDYFITLHDSKEISLRILISMQPTIALTSSYSHSNTHTYTHACTEISLTSRLKFHAFILIYLNWSVFVCVCECSSLHRSPLWNSMNTTDSIDLIELMKFVDSLHLLYMHPSIDCIFSIPNSIPLLNVHQMNWAINDYEREKNRKKNYTNHLLRLGGVYHPCLLSFSISSVHFLEYFYVRLFNHCNFLFRISEIFYFSLIAWNSTNRKHFAPRDKRRKKKLESNHSRSKQLDTQTKLVWQNRTAREMKKKTPYQHTTILTDSETWFFYHSIR